MCGIYGIYRISGPVEPSLVEAAIRALAHRGPDGQGVWIAPDHACGLAHRLLSLAAADNNAQPLVSEDGQLAATVNGEFYGYRALRAALEAKGYRFQSDSDSELVLHLYREYGNAFVHHLRGEFAFILFDARDKKLIAVRDRFGIKPLVYSALPGGGIALASEAKALFAGGVAPRWNHEALYHSMSFQYLPVDQTLFASVRTLPPGHMLVYDAGSMTITRYWDMTFPDADECSDANESKIRLSAALKDAVAVRLTGDNARICCHLSGGVDSALIAALASEMHGSALPCFTVSFPHALYDEKALAAAQVCHIGAAFHPIPVDDDAIIDTLGDAVFYCENLAINSHLSAKFILNREIRRAGFNVALSGEGADELFLGYPHLKQDYLPGQEKHILSVNPLAAGIQLSDAATLPLDLLEKELGFIPGFMRAKAAMGLKLHGLLSEDFKRGHSSCDIYAQIAHNLKLNGLPSQGEPVYRASYAWSKFALAGYILRTLGDGCEMPHAVEGRVPFLDHRLFDVTRAIPPSLKIHNDTEKFILREIARPYVTEAIYRRQKHAFLAPPLGLLSHKRGWQFVNDTLRSPSFAAMPFYDPAAVQRFLNNLEKDEPSLHIAGEPVLFLLLTAFLLGRAYNL